MTQYAALLRGINVGRAKRIAMADLRKMVEGLGHDRVRTLLNSGNVVFEASGSRPAALARSIELAITQTFGMSVGVAVVPAPDLTAIIDENPLRAVVTDPSRCMVAFVSSPAVLAKAKPLLQETWMPEVFAIGARAAYVWCGDGVADSKVLKAFARATGNVATTRNWATVLKLQAAMRRD